MTLRIIEISNDRLHLSKSRGFLCISHASETVGKVPLDDILGIVVTGHGCSHTSNLIASCAEKGIAFVICASNFLPIAYVLPISGNSLQSQRMQLFASLKPSDKNQLWKHVVQAKINNQAWALAFAGYSDTSYALKTYAKQVQSGDATNKEALAAARYWRTILGQDFRRDISSQGVNSLLNYGYTILRSMVARAVCGAGLHPTIGLHHIGRNNPMCLVDDLMEPFRPIVDILVLHIINQGYRDITLETKQVLANLTVLDLPGERGVSPLNEICSAYINNLLSVIAGEQKKLKIPPMPDKLALLALTNPLKK